MITQKISQNRNLKSNVHWLRLSYMLSTENSCAATENSESYSKLSAAQLNKL